jgi:hypothetical protein
LSEGTPQSLSLADAQRVAFERNWDLLAAKSGVDFATAQLLVTEEYPNPTISFSTMRIDPQHGNGTPLGNGVWERSYDTVSKESCLMKWRTFVSGRGPCSLGRTSRSDWFGYLRPGSADEFQHMDSLILEDRAAWPLPLVPVTAITGLKIGMLGTLRIDVLDEPSAEKKLAQHRDWVSRVPGAKHIDSLESAGEIVADQPGLAVESVRSMLRELRLQKER